MATKGTTGTKLAKGDTIKVTDRADVYHGERGTVTRTKGTQIFVAFDPQGLRMGRFTPRQVVLA